MPFLPFNLEDEKKKQQQSNNTNISGVSNVINNNSQAQNAAAPKPVKNSGSWVNLNQYLDANKDNAESMGNTIASNISNTGNQARSGIQNTQDDFNSMVDKGSISNLNTAKEDSDNIVNSARNNAFNNQINDNQVNRFKEVSNAKYSGPDDWSSSQYYNDTLSNLNKSKDYKAGAQTDEGRFNILQEMFNRPTYTQGQKNLDNLLITGNQKAKDSIKNSADSLNGLDEAWSKAQDETTSLASQRKNDSDNVRNYAQNLLSTNRNERNQEVDTDLSDKQNRWADEYNHYNNLLDNFNRGNLELTKQEASKLALTGGEGQKIYDILDNIPASTYLDLKSFDANKVVSKDQYAQLAALDRLANTYGIGSLNKYSNIDDAGTLGLENNFDGSRFGQAANEAIENEDTRQYLRIPTGTHLNPNGNINELIPGNLTGRRDLNGSTLRDLNDYWLPIYNQAVANWNDNSIRVIRDYLRSYLDDVGYNNKVKIKE